MDNPGNKQNNEHPAIRWAKWAGHILEDIGTGLIGFVPGGLHQTYDAVLKRLPLIGRFFSHRWVEQLCKIGTGITIGQGIARDIGHFFLRPVGYLIGAILGITVFTKLKVPSYRGQVAKFFHRISGQTVGGALAGMGLFLIVSKLPYFSMQINLQNILLSAGVGALLGLLSKTTLILAMNMVNNANAATVRRNVQRAKELNSKLKIAAKQKVKSRVLIHAQDIIQQMNGPQSQQYLDEFLSTEYESIALNVDKKIERHFNYLADRACHGDVDALKRLQALHPTCLPSIEGGKNAFAVMLDRIFNARAIFKLKDDVDTAYDWWQYRFLRTKVML